MASSPEIPLDIKHLLHDCILAVFWPKKGVIEFLKSVGCSDSILERAAPEGASRHSIITESFSLLSMRPDRGFNVFQTMIDRFLNWSYFDPYWFETVPKLDRPTADATLLRLKGAIEKRNSATTARRTFHSAAQKQQATSNDLTALTSAFQKMFGTGMNPQARGRLFERFLQELFNRQSVRMGDPFSIVGEQIDGTFKFEGENYIVEAKWQDPVSSTGDLYKFAHKVDGKMHGRGMFISVNGFSHQGIEAIVVGKMIKTILVDGPDISNVVEGRVSLERMLDYKIRAAQTRGDVYVCALSETSKI